MRYADDGGGGAVGWRVRSNLRSLAASDVDDHSSNVAAPLAGRQREQLLLMRDRDAGEIDAELDEIHEGIMQLHDLAIRQGEEVRRHGGMLDVVQDRIDGACERTTSATSKIERYRRKI